MAEAKEKNDNFISRFGKLLKAIALSLAILLSAELILPAFANVSYKAADYEGMTEEYAAQVTALYTKYLSRNKLGRNMTYLQSLLAPSTYAGYEASASIAIGRGEYSEAAEYIQGCIDKYTGKDKTVLSSLHLRKGSLYILCSKFEKALEEIEKALDLNPKSKDAWYLSAEMNAFLGNKEKASKSTEKYIALLSEGEDKKDLGYLYEIMGEYEKALDCYLTLDGKENMVSIARCYIMIEKNTDAKASLEKYFLSGGEDKTGEASAMLCACYLESLEYREALVAFETSEEKGYVFNSDIKTWVAAAYMSEGQYSNALSLYESILKENPSAKNISYYMGLSAYAVKEYEKAKEAFTSSIEEGFELQSSHYYKAVCFVQLGKEMEAVSDLEKVVELGGDEDLTTSARDMLKLLKD